MRYLLFLLFLPVAVFVTSCSRETADIEPLAARAPRILIEAESAKSIQPPVAVFESADASGGKFLEAPEGPDHEEISVGGSAEYEFSVTTAGEYVLWIRKNWSGACGNSLLVKIDDLPEVVFGEDGTYDTWDWALAVGRKFSLAPGAHTLTIKNREDGAKFDQILLTTDTKYVPVGIEEP